MYWFSRAKKFGKTQEYAIFDCIECGCCSYVCPSRIPLVQSFRFAKRELWARERDKQAAENAKGRFEFKQLREEREKAEKAEKLAKAAAAQAAKKAAEAAAAAAAPAEGQDATAAAVAIPNATGDAEKEAKRTTIEAAMARAKAQREAAQPKNVENLTADQQRAAAEIEARRVAASLTDTSPASEKSE